MKSLIFTFFSVFLFTHLNAATYSFQGSPYQTVYGDNYTSQMRITGHMVTSQVLDSDLVSSEILSLIESYSFNDGVQTLTQNNSEFIEFYVSADDDGLPFVWDIKIARTPLANELGEQFDVIHFFYLYNTEGFSSLQRGSSEPCSGIHQGTCNDSSGMTNSGLFYSPGINSNQWTLLGGNGVQAVPINQYQFLALLGLLILLMAFAVLKRNLGNNH